MAKQASVDGDFQDVLFECKGAVAILRLNRPKKLNALTLAMHEAIFRVCANSGRTRV